jgi:hypothetical protein
VIIGRRGSLSLSLAVGVVAFVVLFGQGSSASAPHSHSIAPATAGATYVALGDSYSSGEGLPGARPDEWLTTSSAPTSKADGCDRSSYSFPVLVAKAEGDTGSFDFAACSGVSTGSADDVTSFTKGGSLLGGANGEPSQLDALSPTRTKLISLTIGGNDLGFSKVLAACAGAMAQLGPLRYVASSAVPNASPAKCTSTLAQAMSVATASPGQEPSLEGSLIDTYSKILNAAPSATLFVVTYPQLLTTKPIMNFCPLTGALHVHAVSFYLGIDPDQVTEFNALESDLNADIVLAAQKVNQSVGANRIVVVDVNRLTTDDGQSCNTATMSRSIINGVLFASGDSLAKLYEDCIHGGHSLIGRCRQSISAVKNDFIAKGSLHPKRDGQLLMARAVVAAIDATASSDTSTVP